ncbi:MAG TPA: fumarylacetoacetate hydrolase family protein [Solirubrobacteraceae bacterium]|nr:fumarylacetoacetate hydrolase family protein [Solirubrobacteraceae bacterium]
MRRPYPDGGRVPSIRDFMAFEEHVRNARAVSGRGEVPEAWYEAPRFYFSNPAAVYCDGDEVPRPPDTAALDYELELACVIGENGRPEGFTVMNDWSARDLQAREMQVGLGPAKGKDFATSLGPVLVSLDELPEDLDLRAVARVNGEVRTDSRTGGMYFSWERLLEAAARNTPGLRAGDVIGSGTVGRGCILEHGDQRWLSPGDEVELEIEGIGVLRNRVV